MADVMQAGVEDSGGFAGDSAPASTAGAQIMEIASGFMASKVLLSAVELGLFTTLGSQRMTGEALCAALGRHPRANPDFFDTLVALGLLEREGNGPSGQYANRPGLGELLDRSSPDYMGGFLDLFNDRLYASWGKLSDALRNGRLQAEYAADGTELFDGMYADPDRMRQFLEAMSGGSRANFAVLAERYDFSRHRRLCDVGGALALLGMTVARRHPGIQCLSADIAVVTPLAEREIANAGLSGRVEAVALDMFSDPLPRCDVMTMSHILHDWNLEKKTLLIRKAFEALEPGGAFITIEHLIDDERRLAVPGLLMSLNMLVETGDGFDYTAADFFSWCEEAGFRRGEVLALTPACSAAVVYKPEA